MGNRNPNSPELEELAKETRQFNREAVSIIAEAPANFKGYYGRIIVRCIVTAIMLLLTVQAICLFPTIIEDYFDKKDKTTALSSCENAFYNGNYMEILDYVYLFEAYDNRFEMYFEAGKAYENLTLYRQWQNAADTLKDNAEQYRRKADFYSSEVKRAYEKNRFKESKPVLKKFYDEVSK